MNFEQFSFTYCSYTSRLMEAYDERLSEGKVKRERDKRAIKILKGRLLATEGPPSSRLGGRSDRLRSSRLFGLFGLDGLVRLARLVDGLIRLGSLGSLARLGRLGRLAQLGASFIPREIAWINGLRFLHFRLGLVGSIFIGLLLQSLLSRAHVDAQVLERMSNATSTTLGVRHHALEVISFSNHNLGYNDIQ